MKTAVTNLLDQLAGLLGPLSPFTKAVVPAALSLATAAVDCAFAGAVNASALTIAGSGLVLALVTFVLPNKPKAVVPVPAPVPAPAPVVPKAPAAK